MIYETTLRDFLEMPNFVSASLIFVSASLIKD